MMTRPRSSRGPKTGPSHAIGVVIRTASWRRALPHAERFVARVVRQALADRQVALRGAAEISVVLADDPFVRRLNREHRGFDKPTNVLSFPLEGAAPFKGRPCLLGDVVLAYGTVRREARAEGKSFAEHAAHLLVHGTLHLLGFDHVKAREAAVMEGHEIRILAGMGVPDPYRAAAAEARAA